MSSKQIKLIALILPYMTLFLSNGGCVPREAVLLQSSPATVRILLPIPTSPIFDNGPNHRFKSSIPSKGPIPFKGSMDEDYFQIEASDATDGIKYSQPAVGNHDESSYLVPSKKFLKNRHLPFAAYNPIHLKSKVRVHSSDKALIDADYLDSSDYGSKPKSSHEEHVNFAGNISKSVVENDEYQLNSSTEFNKRPKGFFSNTMLLESQNESDPMAHLLPVSSDNVLTYENSPSSLDKNDSEFTVPVKKSSERAIEDAPSHSGSIFPDSSNLSSTVPEVMTLPPVLSTSHYFESVNQTGSLDNSETTEVPSIYDVGNISSSSISFPSDNDKLSPGTVAGIVIGVLVCATILSSAVIYLLYQKYNGKCTGVVEGKFNSDNCGYLDDSLRSSIYLNNHIELPKESSEEMSSLDNDSFLNSLETMTIQNYWADSSKNTKV